MKTKYLLPNPKYFQVYRGDVNGVLDDNTTVTVNTGLLILCEPRTTPSSGDTYEETIADLYNPDITYVDRLRHLLVPEEDVTVTKTGKLFLKLDTGGTVPNRVDCLSDFGTAVGDQEHPDFHFGASPGPPEFQAAILSKQYAPSILTFGNYIFQEEYPEEVPEEDEELSRNLDSTEIDGSIITVTSITHILIAEIILNDNNMTIRQRHLGPLYWYSPNIRYGDFDYREHS